MKKEQTIKPVEITPEVKTSKEIPKDDMIQIFIDKEMTAGGIRINDKLYVGNVTVSKAQAEDLLRIQEEHWETIKKLKDKNVTVRMKNDFQKERLFLADPSEHSRNRNFSRDYGLLTQQEWIYCSPVFKERLLSMRKQLYGY